MKKFLTNIIVLLLPLSMYVVSAIVFKYDHVWMFFFTNLAYIFAGYISSTLKKSLILSIPFYLIFIFTLFLDDNLTSTIILYLIFIPLSLFIGNLIEKKYFLIIYITSITLITFLGFRNWISFYNNYNSNKNIPFPKVQLHELETDSIVSFNKENNKIIVLDFWVTTCGICFKKFPKFEEVYLKYKNNLNIDFYSVNIPVKSDKLDETKKLVNKLNYKFPTLYAKSSSLAADSLNFNKYPHLIILKNGRIKYSGELITDVRTHNIKNEIQKLINE